MKNIVFINVFWRPVGLFLSIYFHVCKNVDALRVQLHEKHKTRRRSANFSRWRRHVGSLELKKERKEDEIFFKKALQLTQAQQVIFQRHETRKSAINHKIEEPQSAATHLWRQSRSTSKGCGMSPSATPPRNLREHDQPHTPAELPNGSAMPVPSGCARWTVRRGLWLWPTAARTCSFRQTICHPLLLQERQDVTGCGSQQVPVNVLFPASGGLQRSAVDMCCARESRTTTMERAHKCGIDGELLECDCKCNARRADKALSDLRRYGVH